jgi:site-specific DNA-methyltransferase (adenine-specific)
MPQIEKGKIDLILTDLPYGTTACAWDEIIPLEPMWNEFYRVLRPNGFIVLTASQPFTSKLVSSNISNFSHQWIWEKIGSNGNPLLANKMPLKKPLKIF